LIRDIVRFGGRNALEAAGTPIVKGLNSLWWPPIREASGAELREAGQTLLDLRDRLRDEAIDGGWEVT
jgi:hypothetical protein